ncbi:MAG: phage portal protein [Alphaproteobacteria bacterium]|nr:MAG: phage portal protein [Alphaproteobacteria bacterium]
MRMPDREPDTQGKASVSGPLVAYSSSGRPRWTPRRYDSLAEEGFRKNVVAWRCVTRVAQAAATIPWLLYDRTGREWTEHPVLALLQRPNPLQGGVSFFEQVYATWQLSGNVYIEAVRPDDRSPPRELYSLRPDRMKVIPGGAGLPQGYEYSVEGRAVRWPCDPLSGSSPILHWKSFNPLDDWYGMAPAEAALLSIDQHNAAGAWNQALLNQSARPSGALVYAPKAGPSALSDEQFRRLKEELDEHYQSARNAGRPLVLEGGLEWHEMSLSPKDMDWLQGRDAAARDIALAFGVPEQLVGVSDSQTYANMAQARLAMYEETVIPLATQLAAALNAWLLPMFARPGDLRLDIDIDAISALSERRDALWSKLNEADFLTLNEKRAALGYAPVPGGDEIGPGHMETEAI